MRYLNLILVPIVMATFAARVSACPTCKGTLHDNGVATGYAVSILFMMGMPFLISAFWAVVIYRMRKQMRVEAAHASSAKLT